MNIFALLIVFVVSLFFNSTVKYFLDSYFAFILPFLVASFYGLNVAPHLDIEIFIAACFILGACVLIKYLNYCDRYNQRRLDE